MVVSLDIMPLRLHSVLEELAFSDSREELAFSDLREELAFSNTSEK